MLTNPTLCSQVDQLWDKLWSGGLSNPLDAIEQLSYLLFLKRLDDEENSRARQAQRRGLPYVPRVPEEMRWSHWRHYKADAALVHVQTKVFPWLRALGDKDSSFARYMQNAEFKIQKPAMLIDANPVIEGISKGNRLGDDQLLELEKTLRHELGAGELEVSEENIRKAYGYKVGSLLEFLRQLFDLDGIPDYQEIVRRQFETYIAAHRFNGDQIHFLRLLEKVFLQRRRLHPADLYEAPFDSFGTDALDRWFSPAERHDILELLDRLTVVGA